MTANNRIVLSSDHAAIQLRRAIAVEIAAHGWEAVDIGPTTPESTHYPQHGEAAARLVASGDCRLGIILCGTGQGIMMAANKVKGIRCGVCADTFSARMIRQHNDANMLAIGARVVGARWRIGYGPRAPRAAICSPIKEAAPSFSKPKVMEALPLMRMFGPAGNPAAENLLAVIVLLQAEAGVRLEVRAVADAA